MSRVIAVLVVLVLGCGSPTVGAWTISTVVTESTGQGSSTRTLTDTLRIEASGWRVGGGCVAPLAFEGETARLTTTAFCVITDPTEPLFLLGALGRTPNANDRIEVRKATFKVEARDQLRAAVEYRTGADLSDPLSGAVISFETTDGGLLERTR